MRTCLRGRRRFFVHAGTIVVAAAGTAPAQITPQFWPRATGPWGSRPYVNCAVTTDIDGDRDLDVLLGRFQVIPGVPLLELWRNDGDGRFTDVSAAQLLAAGVSTAFRMLAFDANGDGDHDVLVGGYYGTSAILHAQGGTLTAAPMAVVFPGEMEAADLDGDGDLDLAITETGFGQPMQRLWANDGAGGFSVARILGPSQQGSTMHPFDHDGDGDLDLLCGKNPIRLWRNDGGFVFTDVGATTVVQPTGVLLGVHAAGDLDGDGDVDFVSGRNGSPDLVMLQQGGVFAPSGVLPHTLSTKLTLDDVDADGDLDVVHGPTMRLSLNDGTGNFTDGAARMPAAVLASPAVGDLDGDGDTDWLGANSLTSMTLLVNRAVDLDVPAPQIGQPWPVVVASQPGYATASHACVLAVGLVRRPQALTIPGLGDLWLDLGAAALFAGNVPPGPGQTTFLFGLPFAPTLVGLPLHVQGLVEQVPAPPRFTAAIRAVIQ